MNRLRQIGLVAGVFIIWGPLAALLGEALLSLPEVARVTTQMFNARTAMLLVKSGTISGTVAILAMVLAIAFVRFTRGHWLAWLPLALLLVPPYVHASTWMTFSADLQSLLAGLGMPPPASSNIFGTIWIQLTAFFPISLGFALVAFAMTDHRQVEAARVFTNDWTVFRKIEMPQILPAASIGIALVFVLSLTDFTTPSLMRIQVYALEAFVEYSISANSLSSFVLALPLLIISISVITLIARPIRRLNITPLRISNAPSAPILRLTGLVACAFAALQFTMPIIMLSTAAYPFGDMVAIIAQNSPEILNSITTAALAATLSLLLALAILPYLTSPLRLVLVAIPFTVPASLTGIGLIKLWLGSALYSTSAMPVLAAIAQFAPIAILILYAQSKRTQPALIEAARMFQPPTRVWFHILLPQWRAGLLAAFLAVFVLTLAELTAALLVSPPGRQMLTAKIFSMLHFGASQQVATLSLILLLASMLVMGMIYLSLRASTRKPRIHT